MIPLNLYQQQPHALILKLYIEYLLEILPFLDPVGSVRHQLFQKIFLGMRQYTLQIILDRLHKTLLIG
ncbi:hypothetical protein D3C74_454140 [compost metagenome]